MSTRACTHAISCGWLFFDRRETRTHLGGTSDKRAYTAKNTTPLIYPLAGRRREMEEELQDLLDTAQQMQTSQPKRAIPGLTTCQGPRGPRGDKGDRVSDKIE